MIPAAIGDVVGLHYDSAADVHVGHFIVTATGRTYEVLALRRQMRGKHAGRYHLRCRVVKRAGHGTTHMLFWYRR